MKNPLLLAATLLAAIFPPALAAGSATLKSDNDRISYSVGHQVATDLKANGVAINKALLLRAVEDVLGSAKPALSEEDMRATLVEFKRKIVYAQKQQSRQKSAKYRQESSVFLAANAKKEGIVTTGSGLQYRILQTGQGKSPGANDEVTVHYRGTTIDGKEFDSSARKGKPVTFKLDKVMRGWSEGLQLIQEGGKIGLFIPPELAYGERGPLADRALLFDIELLAVKQQPTENK